MYARKQPLLLCVLCGRIPVFALLLHLNLLPPIRKKRRRGGRVFILVPTGNLQTSSEYANCSVDLQLSVYKSFSVCFVNLGKYNTEEEK
jgi:hypothetical protein